MKPTLPLVLLTLAACTPPAEEAGKTPEAGTPTIDITPGTVDFLNPAGGTEILTETFRISNYGEADLVIEELVMAGEVGSFAILEGSEEGTLRRNQSREVTLAWNPVDAASADMSIRVFSNDAAQPESRVTVHARTEGMEEEPEVPQSSQMLDVFVLLDTSYSYSCYHPDLESFVRDLVDELFDSFEDVAVGWGVYDDYIESGWAASNGRPYQVRIPISTDREAVKDAADGVAMVYGGDAPSSGYEALFQATWGIGYDHECDGTLDSTKDVAPFLPDDDDAFAGAVPGIYDSTVEGIGTRPGVGWRDGARHLVVMGADNQIRDAALGHEMPEASCGEPASMELAAQAFTTSDTLFLGINVYEYQSSDHTLQNQLLNFATATGSYIDEDGDGIKAEPAVLYGDWNWPPMEAVMSAIDDLAHD
jgi:hypothetical protein